MGVSRFTQQMQAMLPQWMKMAKDPNSVGAQFLDVFGLEFEDVQKYLDEIIANQFIGTADISQIDITYKVPLALPVLLDLENVDTVVAYRNDVPYHFVLTGSLRQFYTSDEDNTAIIDRERGLVYLRPMDSVLEGAPIERPFDYVMVNSTMHSDYSLHHVWNAFDEFGLLLGIERLYGERNAAFKERILDVFRKPGNSTQQGLVNAISRELGIPAESVKVNELANKAFQGTLLNEDGTPSKKLLSYAERINKVLGFTWDYMSWGEAYWRSVEESNIGLEYLPHIWDATTEGWKDEDFQSGVGDGDDLKVSPPKEESNARKFKYYVGLRGRKKGTETIHPEISFKYKITAKGQIPNEEYKPEVYRYTIVASEIVKLHYIIRAVKDYYKTTVIDFSGPGYTYDTPTNPGVEIITGNTILSNPTDRYLKVIVDMETRSVKDTPQIHSMTIKWRDSNDALNNFTLETQVDFTRNDATVNTTLTNVNVTTSGDMELGYGSFYYMIDTEGSWQDGTHDSNLEITQQGSLKLKLPTMTAKLFDTTHTTDAIAYQGTTTVAAIDTVHSEHNFAIPQSSPEGVWKFTETIKDVNPDPSFTYSTPLVITNSTANSPDKFIIVYYSTASVTSATVTNGVIHVQGTKPTNSDIRVFSPLLTFKKTASYTIRVKYKKNASHTHPGTPELWVYGAIVDNLQNTQLYGVPYRTKDIDNGDGFRLQEYKFPSTCWTGSGTTGRLFFTAMSWANAGTADYETKEWEIIEDYPH